MHEAYERADPELVRARRGRVEGRSAEGMALAAPATTAGLAFLQRAGGNRAVAALVGSSAPLPVQRRPRAETLEALSEAGAEQAQEESVTAPLAVSTVTNIQDISGADSWARTIEGYRGYLQQGRETRTVTDSQITANERVIGALRDYQAMGGEQGRTLTDFQRQAEQVRVDFARLQAQFTHLQVSGFVDRNMSAETQAEQLVAGHGFSSGEDAAAGIRGPMAQLLQGQAEEAHADASRLGGEIATAQEEASAGVYDFQTALNELKAGIIPRAQDPELVAEQREVQGQIDALKGHLATGLTVVSAAAGAATGGTSAIAAAAGAEGTPVRTAVDEGLRRATGAVSPDRVASWIAEAVYDRELNSVSGRLTRSDAFRNQAALLALVNSARTKQRRMTSNFRTLHQKLSEFESSKDRVRVALDRLGEEADRRSGGSRGYSGFASILGDADALVIQIDATKRLGEAEQEAAEQATSAREAVEGVRTEAGGREGAMEYFSPSQHFQLGNWTPWGGRRYGGMVYRATSNTLRFSIPGRVVGSAYGGQGAANPVVAATLEELDRIRSEASGVRRALSTALGVSMSGGGGGSGASHGGSGIHAGTGGAP